MVEIIISVIAGFFTVYLFESFSKSKQFFSNWLASGSLISILMYVGRDYNSVYKFFISAMTVIIILKIFYKKSITKTIVIVLFMYLFLFIAEIISVVSLSLLLNFTFDQLSEVKYIGLYINLAVVLLGVVFINSKYLIARLQEMFSLNFKTVDVRSLITYIMYFLNLSLLVYFLYFDIPDYLIIITLIATSVFVSVLFFSSIIYKYKYLETKYDKDNLLIELSEFEKLIDSFRITNHENKNNLIIIKEMTDNNKAEKYIEEILKENEEYKKTSPIIDNLQSGGLRGLIYKKKNECDQKQLNFNIYVEEKFHIKNDYESYCRLISIYLDNAIEAAYYSLEKKINIGFYSEGIKITNSFDDNLKPKQKGRGFGLIIAKKIISKKKINVERIVVSNIYKTIIAI